MIATGSSDKTVRLWRTDGECVRTLRGHKEWVYCLAFSPAGDILCSGSFDGTLRLWAVSAQLLLHIHTHVLYVSLAVLTCIAGRLQCVCIGEIMHLESESGPA
jgi:WD40 repeat protein